MKRMDFSQDAALIYNYLNSLKKLTKAMVQPKFWENHHQYTIERIDPMVGTHLAGSMNNSRQYNRSYLEWSSSKKGVALLIKYLRIKGKLQPEYYVIKNRVYKDERNK